MKFTDKCLFVSEISLHLLFFYVNSWVASPLPLFLYLFFYYFFFSFQPFEVSRFIAILYGNIQDFVVNYPPSFFTHGWHARGISKYIYIYIYFPVGWALEWGICRLLHTLKCNGSSHGLNTAVAVNVYVKSLRKNWRWLLGKISDWRCQPGFNLGLNHLACLATRKSCDTKKHCLWMTKYIYIYDATNIPYYILNNHFCGASEVK